MNFNYRAPLKPTKVYNYTMNRFLTYLRNLDPRTCRLARRAFLWSLVGLPLTVLLWGFFLIRSHESEIHTIANSILPDSTIVYDRNNRKIGEYFSRYHIYVPLKSIPKEMIDAVLAIEDRDFFKHKGVDWRSLGRAGLSVLKSGRYAQGGSTISMQIVRNYLLTREKTISRKIKEIVLSYQMERTLSKERILELYLNTMYMGNGAYGVGAASMVYFSRPLASLNTAELAVLAGLFKAPSLINPKRNEAESLKRQQLVLRAMREIGAIDEAKFKRLMATKIKFKVSDPVDIDFAPHYLAWIRELVFELIGERGRALNDNGLRIYTTLDYDMQQAANQSIAAASPRLKALEERLKLTGKDSIEAALLSVDRRDGSVLAMVGGTDFARSEYNRTIAALRSPGSAFKPVVYAAALSQGLRLNDLIDTAPKSIERFAWNEQPGELPPQVTLRTAFALSLNNPAVNLLATIGISPVIRLAAKMGVRSAIPKEYGIALGGFSLRMTDMARVYSTIANEGVPTTTRTITKITDRDGKTLYAAPKRAALPPAFEPQVSQQLTEAMHAVLTEGTGSSASYLGKSAVGKTGTSDDGRDNWFCGYTKNIATVVWVGSDLHSPLGRNASGAALALPIWAQAVSKYRDAAAYDVDVVQSVGSRLLEWFYNGTSRM
jgi:penicillin-binding protein 1A